MEARIDYLGADGFRRSTQALQPWTALGRDFDQLREPQHPLVTAPRLAHFVESAGLHLVYEPADFLVDDERTGVDSVERLPDICVGVSE